MVELVVVGVVAGFLAGISPCILPVLPVVLVAGAEPGQGPPGEPAPSRPGIGRPLAVIAGLVLSFSFLVLAGSEALSLLRLPQDFLRDAGIVVLLVVGLGYLIPALGTLLERPFARVGVHYPVAIDDNYATWNAYSNEYWPADYLIDSRGDVRHVHFGEGDYANTELLIRQLLHAARPGVSLPPATDVADKTPAGLLSPETYVGYQRLQYLDPGNQVVRNAPTVYHFPASLPLGALGLKGTWTDHAQEATAGARAELELGFHAQEVYLVLAGRGKLSVSVDGRHTKTVTIGGVPGLYTLYQAGSARNGTLLLHAAPGVQAYDFTFG
jgi:thioredoxin family protein